MRGAEARQAASARHFFWVSAPGCHSWVARLPGRKPEPETTQRPGSLPAFRIPEAAAHADRDDADRPAGALHPQCPDAFHRSGGADRGLERRVRFHQPDPDRRGRGDHCRTWPPKGSLGVGLLPHHGRALRTTSVGRCVGRSRRGGRRQGWGRGGLQRPARGCGAGACRQGRGCGRARSGERR